MFSPKTLIAAAALAICASAPQAKAYDTAPWGLTSDSYNAETYSFYNFQTSGGGTWVGTRTDNLVNLFDSRTRTLATSGLYLFTGQVNWSGNTYNSGNTVDQAEMFMYANGAQAGYKLYPQGVWTRDILGNNGINGSYTFPRALLPIETTTLGLGWTLQGDDGDSDIRVGYYSVVERAVQVARTGTGLNGDQAYYGFESDNSATLNANFYNSSIVGRNVLRVATSGATSLAGSVVRTGDMTIGLGQQEGLFVKDGGWLDIRGDLTLASAGSIYVRDAEVTANVYTQYYTPGTLNVIGTLTFDSGILSVRSHFAQDMVATYGQTLGLRDGAVNNSRLYLSGYGYGDFDGLAVNGEGEGALRSITGTNTQNGNISIVYDGEGGTGALIGVDLGSQLTINGAINGLNNLDSNGGASVGFNVEGEAIVNGAILGGITDVDKLGGGELRLNSANFFSGAVNVNEGTLRVTHSGALSSSAGSTSVSDGAALVLDQAAGITLADDIYVAGNGNATHAGAIRNVAGTNTINADVILDVSATVLVSNGTSLTVTGDVRSNNTGASTHLFVASVNQGGSTGNLFIDGDLLGINQVTKNGDGNARIDQVDRALGFVNVNGGTLTIRGAVDSTAGNPYGYLVKNGAGIFEVLGNHHYADVNFNDGTSEIRGNLTLQGSESNGDFDVRNDAVLNINSGASLVHVSSGALFANSTEIADTAVLNVRSGGVVNLNGAGLDISDTGSLNVAGTFTSGNGIYANNGATVQALLGGVINANIRADDSSKVYLRTGGAINGNVETFDNAEFVIETGSTHTGDYNAYGSATVVVNGTIGEGSLFAQNFRLAGSALLKGSGRINGSLLQTGGVVAPGNSPGILNIGGAYSISAGSLQVEIDGLAGAGAVGGHDQLRVGGAITLSGTSVLNFDLGNSYQAQRGAVFQVLADATGASKASNGQFNTVLWQDSNFRVLFDHSTGLAYGTGLNYGQSGNSFQTFTQYADNANRLEIARALWMESIDYDNTDLGLNGEGAAIVDQNYPTTATGVNGVADAQAKRGYKAYILTNGGAGTQTATDLGQAAVGVLTAADVGAALDALSPEAYAGITDLGIRVARGFAFLPFNQRRMGAVNEWDFSVGYNNDEVESDATSSYNSYKVRSNQVNVTAARDLGANARFSLGVGSDEGKVLARNFSANVDTLGLGLGLILKPDSDAYRLDLGVAFTTSDWDSTRQGVSAGNDMETAAFAARLTVNTKAQGNFSYKPFAALSYTDANIDSFVEGDVPGSVQLGVSGFERTSLLGELGMDFEYKLGAQTYLTGIVSWQHEFQDSGATDMTAEFVEDGVDDTAFSVRAAGFGQDFFRAGLGLRHDLNANSAVSLSVNAIFGSDIGSGHQIRADYSFRF